MPKPARGSLAALTALAFLLVGCSADSHTPPPAPAHQNPLEEVVSCLDDAGYPGFVIENGGVRSPSDISEDQFGPMQEAVVACQKQAGFYLDGIPAEELPRLYDLELVEQDCLRDLGYDSPPPPSVQTFIDEYGTEDAWEAFGAVFYGLPDSEQTEELYNSLQRECPRPSDTFTAE